VNGLLTELTHVKLYGVDHDRYCMIILSLREARLLELYWRYFSSGDKNSSNSSLVNDLNQKLNARFQFFTAVKIQGWILWFVMPCSIAVGYNFRGLCCLKMEVARSSRMLLAYCNSAGHYKLKTLTQKLNVGITWPPCCFFIYKKKLL
jgi:hypothetical protein